MKTGLAIVALTAACGADPLPSPDAGMPAPDAAPLIAPDASVPEDALPSLIEGAPIDAVQIPLGAADGPIVLIEDGLIARRAGEAWWIGTATAVNLGTVGRLTGGVPLGGGTALVLAEDGARIFTGNRLVPSAIADALGGNAARRAVRSDDGALWLATESGLFVYTGGEGRAVTPTGLPTERAELAFGAPIAGRKRTWIAAGGRTYALDTTRATYEADAPTGIASIAVDPSGILWARAGDALFVRDASGRWHPETVAVAAVSAAWIARANGGGIAAITAGSIQTIAGLDPTAELVAPAIARVGGQLIQVVPGARVAVLGLADGAVLTASTAVVAYGLDQPLTLTMDGAPLSARPFRGGLRAVIPAATLAEGPHTLVARAGSSERTIAFSSLTGGVPTWTADIEPFFRSRCATCHRTGGNAHDLDGSAHWRVEIDRILAAVRERRMPLPPYPALEPDEVALIDGWKSAGFPE